MTQRLVGSGRAIRLCWAIGAAKCGCTQSSFRAYGAAFLLRNRSGRIRPMPMDAASTPSPAPTRSRHLVAQRCTTARSGYEKRGLEARAPHPPDRLELFADHTIDRVGPAAPNGDQEGYDADQQYEFVAALTDSKTLGPMHHKHRDEHFDRERSCEEAGEQADDEAGAADRFQEHRRVGKSDRWLETVFCHRVGRDRCGTGFELAGDMHDKDNADNNTHQRVGDIVPA